MSSNTWGVERKHLKVTTKKEGVSERGVTRLVTNMSHADQKNKTLPLEQLCCITLPGWTFQKYTLVHMTDSCPHTCCCWCGLCLCSPRRLQAAGLSVPYSPCPLSWEASWKVSPHDVLQLTGQSQVCCHCCSSGAPYKTVPPLRSCQEGFCKCPVPSSEMKRFYSIWRHLWQQDSIDHIKSESTKAAVIHKFLFSKSYSMRWPAKKGMAIMVKVLYFLSPFICAQGPASWHGGNLKSWQYTLVAFQRNRSHGVQVRSTQLPFTPSQEQCFCCLTLELQVLLLAWPWCNQVPNMASSSIHFLLAPLDKFPCICKENPPKFILWKSQLPYLYHRNRLACSCLVLSSFSSLLFVIYL